MSLHNLLRGCGLPEVYESSEKSQPESRLVFKLPKKLTCRVDDALMIRAMHFHQLHQDKEWSGQLKYTASHINVMAYDSIVLVAKDFIPYDLGNDTRTTIDYSKVEIQPDEAYIPDYWDDFRDVACYSIREGLIHSHHTMDTFFSDTDQPTLIERAHTYSASCFFSLIVNEEMVQRKDNKWKARLAWHTVDLKDGSETPHALYYNNKLLGKMEVPACFWAEVDVMPSFMYDKEHQDAVTYKRLFPEYEKRHTYKVQLTKKFAGLVVERLTLGKVTSVSGVANISKLATYLDKQPNLKGWLVPRICTIINELIAEGNCPITDPDEEYTYKEVYVTFISYIFKNIVSYREAVTSEKSVKALYANIFKNFIETIKKT